MKEEEEVEGVEEGRRRLTFIGIDQVFESPSSKSIR